jgi:NAD(P)-dependent dehydrogenase (short-subunit alcohol dehydrogenase family)
MNAIAPGEIDTPILSPGIAKIVESIPMQRPGTPDEVAKIIYMLCTETASYVNGAEIHTRWRAACLEGAAVCSKDGALNQSRFSRLCHKRVTSTASSTSSKR